MLFISADESIKTAFNSLIKLFIDFHEMPLFAPRLFPFFVAIAQLDFDCVYVDFLFADYWRRENVYVIYYSGDEIMKIYSSCIDFPACAFFLRVELEALAENWS